MRIDGIKKRLDDINAKKLQAQAQLQVLEPQYNQKVEELKQLGITDFNNIPKVLEDLQKELEQLLQQAETNLTQLEEQLSQ
jgi:F0F1-type ATP synthase membrane subunit b/b'